MIVRKDRGEAPPPNEVYTDFGILDESTRHDAALQLSRPYCNLVTHFLSWISSKVSRENRASSSRTVALGIAARK
jgi:hypothetical protein